jgi:flagellar hook-associated protein 1 FlgK
MGKNTGLLATDKHNFTGQTVFAVTDSDGKLTNKVTIDFTAIGSTVADLVNAVNAGLGGAATLSLTNGIMSFTGTAASNFVAIAEDGVTPSNRGGRGFSHFFGMNDLVEARVPNHFDSGFAATDGHNFTAGGKININITNKHGIVLENYTMTITGTSFNDLLTDLNASNLSGRVNFSLDAKGALVVTSIPASANYNLEVVSDTTSRASTNVSMSGLFGLGLKYKSDSAFDLRVKDNIRSNPGSLGLAKFNHTGAVGDVVLAAGDQKGANALQNVENNVLNFEASGGLGKMNATINQYAAALLADIGLRSQLNDGYREDNKALTVELSQRVSDYSGVNLDEELGNIIIYQNAYSASARLITTAKELYDELLRLV